MNGEHEAALVARAANGETEAFRLLFEQHHAAMFRFAYRLTGAVDAAEDITHESFVLLMERRSFDHRRGPLRHFLYGIVRNLVRHRNQRNSREIPWDSDGDHCHPFVCPAVVDSAADLSAAVQAALSVLPPLQREAVVLCDFEELSLADAAVTVACDVGTMKSRLHRGRENLRRILAPCRDYLRVQRPKGNAL